MRKRKSILSLIEAYQGSEFYNNSMVQQQIEADLARGIENSMRLGKFEN